jgi:hypothetical protein
MPKTANTRATIRHLAVAGADLGLTYHRSQALSGIIQEANRLLGTIDDELDPSLAALTPEGRRGVPIFSHSPGFPLRDPRTLESDQDIPAGDYVLPTAEAFGFLSDHQRLRIDDSCIDTLDRDPEDNSLTGGDFTWGGFQID